MKGDTLGKIAQKYNTTVEAIMRLNKDITNKDVIKEGQHINLPGEKKNYLAGIKNGIKSAGVWLSRMISSIFGKKNPTYFNQRQFDALNGTSVGDKTFAFGTGKYNALCNATSMINEMSEEYTKMTGKQLTYEQAVRMLQAGLKDGTLKSDGWTEDKFFNSGWGSLGLEGSWSRNDSGSGHQIYKTTGWYLYTHFVNSGPSGNYSISGKVFDTWTGMETTLPSTARRETRNYDFTP